MRGSNRPYTEEEAARNLVVVSSTPTPTVPAPPLRSHSATGSLTQYHHREASQRQMQQLGGDGGSFLQPVLPLVAGGHHGLQCPTGYRHDFVDSCGNHYSHDLPYAAARYPPPPPQPPPPATVFHPLYLPQYPQSAGPTQTQFPPWFTPQVDLYYFGFPHPPHPPPVEFMENQIPNMSVPYHLLPLPLPPQPVPLIPDRSAPFTRRHSYPVRQYPQRPKRVPVSEPRNSQFIAPAWDGRPWDGNGRQGPSSTRGGAQIAPPPAGGHGHRHEYPYQTLAPSPSHDLPQSVSSSGTSGITTPRTANTIAPPSRKPRQTGHALWVGNLPSDVTILDLRDLFFGGADQDEIESIFLICRTCCAFVNYRSSKACLEAMGRFHDTWFQNIRLVCRLRRGSGVLLSSGPRVGGERGNTEEGEERAGGEGMGRADRIFIVKSLTVEDLDESVRTGVWATQSHNEGMLNDAFETAENVYLIFSANKSGEYYGYGRMASSIISPPLPPPSLLPSLPPTQQPPSQQPPPQQPPSQKPPEPPEPSQPSQPLPPPKSPSPRPISHPPQPTASPRPRPPNPRDRIYHDPVRETVFWEPHSSPSSPLSSPISSSCSSPLPSHRSSTRPYGREFGVDWLSTTKVPFHKTKGMRNPWNAGREVKVARDGTEVETTVGKMVLRLFHEAGEAGTGPSAAGAGTDAGGDAGGDGDRS